MARVEALVEPDLLVWARETAGLTVEEASKKVPTTAERLTQWENGERRPTFNQLRKLANAYKRPIAVFYLPAPPKDFRPLQHDFRRLAGGAARAASPWLLYEIRRAHSRREVALDLYGSAGEKPPAFSLRASLTEDPEDIAARLRQKVTADLPDRWASSYDALNFWRTHAENAGVLVFQAEKTDLSEMRGLSISETQLPIAILNIKDAPSARIFTLVHELVHLMLREGGICDLQETSNQPENRRIEVFCNAVAGATLVPAIQLFAHGAVQGKPRHHPWSETELGDLARHFGVSREVVLRRMLTLGRTTAAFYQKKHKEFADSYAGAPKRNEGLAPPYRMVLSTAGPLFARLVLTNYDRDSITASDVSDFLGVRLKHLPKIEAELFDAK